MSFHKYGVNIHKRFFSGSPRRVKPEILPVANSALTSAVRMATIVLRREVILRPGRMN